MDSELPELGWSTEKQLWAEHLDTLEERRFSDVTGAMPTVSFWSTPQECFRAELSEQWESLLPKLRRLLDKVSSANWQDGCKALGLRVPDDLESTDRWIVTVGSIFEPEVGLIMAEFARFVHENIPGGDSGFKFLNIVDIGFPADPEYGNSTWVTCPGSLQAQALSSLKSLQSGDRLNSLFFYFTSTNRSGYGVGVEERTSCAIGVLRCYFTSLLLSPTDRQSSNYSAFIKPRVPSSVTADRLSVFLEFALDLSNLDKLIAAELLARWKRRFFLDSVPTITLPQLTDWFSQCLHSRTKDAGGFFRNFAEEWFRKTGVNPKQYEALVSFKSWINATKAKALEAQAAIDLETPSPAPPSNPSLWQRIKSFLGLQPPSLVQPVSRENSLRSEIAFSDGVLGSLSTLLTLLREISEPGSVFQDVKNDAHLEIAAANPSVLIARYRRLPLDHNCPPYIREFLSTYDADIPNLVFEALNGPEQLASWLVQQISDRWRSQARYDADTQWQRYGIAQWIGQDPALSNHIAQFVSRELIPLWKPFNYEAENWQGFMTLFDYGVLTSSLPTPETFAAVMSIRSALARPESGTAVKVGTAKQDFAMSFESGVHWERWPRMFSLGILWTDTAHRGMGFLEAWDNQEFLSAMEKWGRKHPDELAWISGVGPCEFFAVGRNE